MTDADGQPMHSWRVLILPYIEEKKLYDQYDFSEPWNSPHNSQLLSHQPSVYRLHGADDVDSGETNYLAVVGTGTMWPGNGSRDYDSVTDGISNTIHIVENVGSGILWMEPRDLDIDSMAMTLADDPPNGISSWLQPPAVSLADGSVRSLPLSISADALRGSLLVNDGKYLDSEMQELQDGRDRPHKNSPEAR